MSTALDFRVRLASCKADDAYVQFDGEVAWVSTLQDIVRRSPTIHNFQVITSFTCTRMDPDGFGGMVMVISAEDVLVRSTDAMIDKLIGIAEYGPVGVEPGIGSHVLLRLCEEQVRATVSAIFEAEAPSGLEQTDVTNADIRQASLDVKSSSDLSHEEAHAAFKAALAAIRIAAKRKAASA